MGPHNYHVASIDGEAWLPVSGFDGYYEVSNMGRIKSLARTIDCIDGSQRRYREKIISVKGMMRGHPLALLCRDGRSKSYRVNRLVAIAFIPNPENKPEVNHKNGITADNTVKNLEWNTGQENTLHGRRVLGMCVRERHGQAKLTMDKINEARELRKLGMSYPELGRRFSVSHVAIRNALIGKTWRVW